MNDRKITKLSSRFSCSIFFVSTPPQQLVVSHSDEFFWFPTIPLAEKSHKEDPWYWSARLNKSYWRRHFLQSDRIYPTVKVTKKWDFSSAYNASKHFFFLRFRVWITNLLHWFVTSHTNLHGTDRVSLISFFYAKFIFTFLKIIFFGSNICGWLISSGKFQPSIRAMIVIILRDTYLFPWTAMI